VTQAARATALYYPRMVVTVLPGPVVRSGA
jgi:hypothetical protein